MFEFFRSTRVPEEDKDNLGKDGKIRNDLTGVSVLDEGLSPDEALMAKEDRESNPATNSDSWPSADRSNLEEIGTFPINRVYNENATEVIDNLVVSEEDLETEGRPRSGKTDFDSDFDTSESHHSKPKRPKGGETIRREGL